MDKCYGIIYKATNKINGKMYIGQTIQLLNRRITHHINDIKRLDTYFSRALKKYGKENFEWAIVAEPNSLEELNAAETAMIKKHDTFENGYNLTEGGEGRLGYKLTEEAKRKIGEANKDRKPSKETREKMSEAKKGKKRKPFSAVTKKRMSEAKKDKKFSKEHREKLSESKKGGRSYFYGKRGSESFTAKKYIITTPEGEEILVHGIVDFCRNYGREELDPSNLINVAKGRCKHTKGYKCRYFDEEPPLCDKYDGRHNLAKKYIVTTPEGKKILVHGLREFCKNYEEEKLYCSGLTLVAQGKYKQYKGYKCRYWEEKNEV